MTDKKINLLNATDPGAFTKRLSRNYEPHVVAWANSTLARWLSSREDLALQCCSYVEYRSPTMVLMRKLMDTLAPSAVAGLHQHFWPVEEEELPEWAKPVLARNELHRWSSPNEEETGKIVHMLDYCATLPARQIKSTVEHLQENVRLWDRQLTRQNLIESLPDDLELVKHFDDDDGHFLVKLLTENAYKAEGAIMHHCVGGYWGRNKVSVFSLRKHGEKQPVATIELRSSIVAQVQGPRNTNISEEAMALLQLWANENQMFFDDESEDEEEEDDEDIGMDEEEYDEEDEEDDMPRRHVPRRGGRARDDDDEEEDDEDYGDECEDEPCDDLRASD